MPAEVEFRSDVSGFVFGRGSLNELRGVEQGLVDVTLRALQMSVVDFAVHDGIRYPIEQAELVRTGASWTLNSRHLPTSDGPGLAPMGHAVDLVPYVGGRLRWEWPLCFQVARAMKTAAEALDVEIRWGGYWGLLSEFLNPDVGHERYLRRKLEAGETPHADGPHFEIPA